MAWPEDLQPELRLAGHVVLTLQASPSLAERERKLRRTRLPYPYRQPPSSLLCVDLRSSKAPLWMQEKMNKVLCNMAYGVSSGAVKCWNLTVGNEVSKEGLLPVHLSPLSRSWATLPAS